MHGLVKIVEGSTEIQENSYYQQKNVIGECSI